jgi:rhomboid protease GluP
MATCKRCGRDLPSFSFGDVAEVCSQCQEAESQDATPTKLSFPVTNSVLAVNILVFIAMVADGVSPTGGTPRQLVRWGADYGPLTLAGQWWRLLTSAFVHVGIVHLAINMWCLWNLGRFAELHLGRRRFAFMYVASAIFASLVSLLWNPNNVSAGASGAVFGIAGALISTLKLGATSASADEIKEQLKSLIPFCLYNLFIGAVVPGIDNAAHLGGLFAGLIFGAVLALTTRRQQRG